MTLKQKIKFAETLTGLKKWKANGENLKAYNNVSSIILEFKENGFNIYSCVEIGDQREAISSITLNYNRLEKALKYLK